MASTAASIEEEVIGGGRNSQGGSTHRVVLCWSITIIMKSEQHCYWHLLHIWLLVFKRALLSFFSTRSYSAWREVQKLLNRGVSCFLKSAESDENGQIFAIIDDSESLHHCSARSNFQTRNSRLFQFLQFYLDMLLDNVKHFWEPSILDFDRIWAECGTKSSIWSGGKSSNSSYYLISAKNKLRPNFFSLKR